MATVYPFRAYRYNPSVAAFDRVLTQPYDKITPAMQEKYYAADPHNLISIEKGRTLEGDTREHNVYTRAAVTLKKWIAEKAVVQDDAPSFYAYTQEYGVPGTSLRRTRRGFIGLGKLEDYSAGVIFRHEHTLSGPKADRLELLRHTRTHTGQLFMLYADPRRQVDTILGAVESEQPQVTQLTDEYGVIQRLWPIAEPERLAAFADIQALRAAGWRVEYPFKDLAFGKQFKAATESGARLALIYGSDELAKGVVKLRDLTQRAERDVPRAQVLAAVRDLLSGAA